MTDLFGEFVPFEFIGEVYRVMGLAQQHTFQVLTKRPERRVAFYEWADFSLGPGFLPMPNVWEGVSVEDQATADERIPHLLKCPAAVRWLSMEPLLGPIDLTSIHCSSGDVFDATYGWREAGSMERVYGVDWIVVGGESGPRARSMHPRWPLSIRDQCVEAGVPFFMKQLSSHGNPNYKRFEMFPDDLQVRQYPDEVEV